MLCRVVPRLAFVLVLVFASIVAQAAPPPAPSNLRSIVLPAEIVLSWDPSPGAVYYRVLRAGLDRRWALDLHVTETRIRDSDFQSLPCYFQVTAHNAGGEASSSVEFLVSDGPPSLEFLGVNPRPVSDTSFAIAWNLTGPGDALLEVGTSPTNYLSVISSGEFASRQEFTVSDLAPTTTYFYRITSANPSGIGVTYSGSFATRAFVEPAPTFVTITSDNSPAGIATDEDIPVRITLTTDNPGGAPLTYSITQPPYDGSLLGTPPDLLYVPGPEKSNLDQFQVAVTDGLETRTAIVSVDVHLVHDSPIAHDQSATINEDTGIKIRVSAFTFDTNPSSLTYLLVSCTTNGVLTHDVWFLAADEFQYIPNTNFNGIDHFTFVATDGQTTGNVATVRIRVAPVSDLPFALNQAITISRGSGPVSISLNYGDADGDTLSFNVVNGPRFGTLDTFLRPQVAYTPRAPFTNNTDSFTYTVSDGVSAASGTVTITVVPTYSLPVGNSFSVITESNQPASIHLSGTAFNGTVLSNIWLITPPALGSLTGTAPDFTYAPYGLVGADRIVYRVIDALGIPSADATVSISVVAPTAPLAPSALLATAVSSTQIDLQWTDNSRNEDGFQIERSNDNKSWKLVATVGPNVSNYSNTGLSGNKTYAYRVRAFNRTGTSDYSNTASTKTLK